MIDPEFVLEVDELGLGAITAVEVVDRLTFDCFPIKAKAKMNAAAVQKKVAPMQIMMSVVLDVSRFNNFFDIFSKSFSKLFNCS